MVSKMVSVFSDLGLKEEYRQVNDMKSTDTERAIQASCFIFKLTLLSQLLISMPQ